MQRKDIVIAMIVVFLFAVIVMVGATLIFGGDKGPSPTPTLTPTPAATIPTTVPEGPYIPPNVTYVPTPTYQASPTVRPSVTGTPVPTSSGPKVTSAVLMDHGTDKQVYNRGDTATGFVTIKNTGNTIIDNVMVNVSVSKYISFLGYVKVGEANYPYGSQNIQPQETRRLEFTTTIPKEYQGMSTAGDFQFEVSVSVEGKDVGSFTQAVKVQ